MQKDKKNDTRPNIYQKFNERTFFHLYIVNGQNSKKPIKIGVKIKASKNLGILLYLIDFQRALKSILEGHFLKVFFHNF